VIALYNKIFRIIKTSIMIEKRKFNCKTKLKFKVRIILSLKTIRLRQ